MSIQHIEAEQMVLGSLLLDGELIKECDLIERYFSMGVYQTIFNSIRKIKEDGLQLDKIILLK
ncbi:DnaB-like helicase N-terminal domain-containing protein [Bacillus pseudomycoides]|uniref:DnaB-like helicase N-terminal domain-containing protein n=1 Tax=Bacillus pseudomycoides TaxID=64104 RepID=UPI000BF21F3F|nr:DnaB-like helicase N-terminal domain-containing protein [Bacillus pseudomycoides]PEJ35487.1 hypothetical protein CN677_13400 [Bacillus pseudomycoides]PHA80586.1 hypothetical protein COE78_26465 [Bacillus pseudomycoides]PHC78589.1 hypothetical protein COF38_05045 [Bacillus pseudomycoides]